MLHSIQSALLFDVLYVYALYMLCRHTVSTWAYMSTFYKKTCVVILRLEEFYIVLQLKKIVGGKKTTHCLTDLTPAAWRTAADSPQGAEWGRWPLALSPAAPLPSSAPAASPAPSAADRRPPGSNARVRHFYAFKQRCAPLTLPTANLLVQRLSGGVQFLLQRQQSRAVLLLHDGEVPVVLLSRSGQHVGATEIHHLLLHAVHCCLGDPLLLDVLQRKTKRWGFIGSQRLPPVL